MLSVRYYRWALIWRRNVERLVGGKYLLVKNTIQYINDNYNSDTVDKEDDYT